MVLIYVHQSSSRLQYIAAFVFKDILKTPYSITTHKQGFKNSDCVKINYSDEKISDDELQVHNCGLLGERGIKEPAFDVSEFKGFKIFFRSPATAEMPFDIFSASFYLISRYEEYLPHKKDKYGRYSHENSLAYRENFLNQPLVNIWINYLRDCLIARSTTFKAGDTGFSFTPTYDIDMAYSYLNKGFLRNAVGGIISFTKFKFPELATRLKVLARVKKDPFNNFSWLDKLHHQHKLSPVYFFLVAEKNGLYDKNVLPAAGIMQHLIFDHAKKYSCGLHPSWQSGDNFGLMQKEKKMLENFCGTAISKSRQHYLRFNLPGSYRLLLAAELSEEYSMGYGTANGFRASVASSFYWYDLEKEEQTKLKIHPFCYMDNNAIFHEKLSVEKAYDDLTGYYNVCKNVGGTFITIFHNHLLGDDNIQWSKMYEKFLDFVSRDEQKFNHEKPANDLNV